MDNQKLIKPNSNNFRDFFISIIKSEKGKDIIQQLYNDEDMELIVKKLIKLKKQKNHD